MKTEILFEDKDIIVAIKEAGIPSQPDKTGDEDIMTALANQCGHEVFIINRLDRPVGGIMVFGKNEFSAKSLSLQMQQKNIKKEYYAVVCGKPKNESDCFMDYLLKSQKDNQSKVVSKETKGSKEARLSYKVIETIKDDGEELSLVKVELDTGRHHQIRVQFASRELPLWCDLKYNKNHKEKRKKGQIGLYSYFLSFSHPRTKEEMKFLNNPQKGIFEKFDIISL